MSKWVHDQEPYENGWYNTLNISKRREGLIMLSLWRDGEWADVTHGTKVAAYDPVMVMADTKGHKIMNDKGAVQLAALIIEGICRNYRIAYRKACNVRDNDSDLYKSEVDAQVRSLRRMIRSQYFCNLSLGIIDSDIVLEKLERQATA